MPPGSSGRPVLTLPRLAWRAGQRVPRRVAHLWRGRHQGVQDLHSGVQGPVRGPAVPTILVALIPPLRHRDKYVSGEFRFRHGYCKSNPRKMVRTWAEKELRNLRRLHDAGIACPQPILLRSHVLLMQFIGKRGWCALPRITPPLSPGRARTLMQSLPPGLPPACGTRGWERRSWPTCTAAARC